LIDSKKQVKIQKVNAEKKNSLSHLLIIEEWTSIKKKQLQKLLWIEFVRKPCVGWKKDLKGSARVAHPEGA